MKIIKKKIAPTCKGEKMDNKNKKLSQVIMDVIWEVTVVSLLMSF